MSTGFIYQPPRDRPVGFYGATLPNSYINFYYTGTLTLAPIYSNQNLTGPLPNPVVADGTGSFPTIFLDPAITYRVQFYDKDNNLQYDQDPAAYVQIPSVPTILSVYKTISTSIANSTVLVKDSDLQIQIPNTNAPYIVEAALYFFQTTPNAAGHQFQFQYSGSLGSGPNVISGIGYVNSALYSTPGYLTFINNIVFDQTAVNVTGVGDFIHYRGMFNPSSIGTLSLYWAQAAPSTNASYVSMGSYIKLSQIKPS